MKSCIIALVATLSAVGGYAQENKLISRFELEARGDYQRTYLDGDTDKDNCGFDGRYLNLRLDGNISEQFSYSYRQRFNKASLDAGFFNATDWIYLNYHPNEVITLSAGKQPVDIGGFEYDRAPIDLYFCSEFWNQVPCYEWAARAAWQITDNDNLRFQVSQSPFRSFYQHTDMYAYNLMWVGSHGIWSTLWSANMIEWCEGHYISYLALGNTFRFTDKLRLELDFMNRAASGHAYLFRNCSVMGELRYQPTARLSLFAKATYDVNKTDRAEDLVVYQGTEMTMVGGGIEYFPLADNRVRLHATCSYAFGTNTHPSPVMLDKQNVIDLGLTWRLNFVK